MPTQTHIEKQKYEATGEHHDAEFQDDVKEYQ